MAQADDSLRTFWIPLAAISAIVVVGFYTLNKVREEQAELRARRDELRAAVNKSQKEVEDLMRQRDGLRYDPVYLEKVAREQLEYLKPGEEILPAPEPDPDVPNAADSGIIPDKNEPPSPAARSKTIFARLISGPRIPFPVPLGVIGLAAFALLFIRAFLDKGLPDAAQASIENVEEGFPDGEDASPPALDEVGEQIGNSPENPANDGDSENKQTA
ncbi:MAG TPA: septum formation initiator family protein [Candidatus Brocadiia bacterium]|nr:septum formation initiator family protein [Candidatus Brocadiia bacterium]